MAISKPRALPLDPGDEAKVAKWLQDKGCRCGSCGQQAWGQGNGGRLGFDSGLHGQAQPGQYPVVLVTCRNCGCVAFFCPFVMGLG